MNRMIQWINIDLLDSIDVHKKVYHDMEREMMIECSILDTGWTDKIPKNKHVIVIV